MRYICEVCNIPFNFNDDNKPIKKIEYNWKKTLLRYLPNQESFNSLTMYDDKILGLLDSVYHQSFIDDNISINTMKKYGLKYYQYAQQVAIPIYDDENNFVGIHARNFKPESIELGYKYIPMKTINGDEYKFPTSQVLYGLNMNKENIKKTKSIALFEAPKSVLQMEEILDVNISVGMFGMSLKTPQRNLILKYEVSVCYICIDKQYMKMYKDGVKTEEFMKYEKKVMAIYKDLKSFIPNIYVIYDNSNLLEYKDSPSDKGKNVWDILFKNKEKMEKI
jgi:hypothetical protein